MDAARAPRGEPSADEPSAGEPRRDEARREEPYREHRPTPELRAWVECLWTRIEGPGGPAHPILPDGCADLLFGLDGAVAEAFAVGPMTRPRLVAPRGRRAWVAVRFRPGAARAALGVPLDRLRDGSVALCELWPDAAAVTERVAAAARESTGEGARALAGELARRLATAREPDPLVASAADLLARRGGACSVAALAERLGVSRQHLARRFREEVGHGPKLLARVLRLRRALALLRSPAARPLALVALEAGYYDQPHMGLELRALAGATARELRCRAAGAGSGS